MTNKLISLSGKWTILKDPLGIGRSEGWERQIPVDGRCDITVPDAIPSYSWAMHFSYSNVFPSYHGAVWYYKELSLLPSRAEGERILIEFDRGGYLCQVFINGIFLGEHRHHEERFSFDITPYLKGDGADLVAVRCFEPLAVGEPIDGIRLSEIPNGVWANSADVLPGVAETFCMECFGGLTGEVRLLSVPVARIDDVFIRPFPKSGEVDITVTVINAGDAPLREKLSLTVTEQKRGADVLTDTVEAEIPVGRSELRIKGKIEAHKLWDLDHPFLYIASLSLSGGSRYTSRFGFRELLVKDGFFFLNGRRILLKGSHAITSISNVVSMKALGFNMIRSIHRSFIKEVMDVCDEVGMLVVESPVTAWGMTMHENTAQMVFDYTANMVKLHRNHPSLCAFYLFNELYSREILHCGADALPRLRDMAPDSLFFLSSGRWDAEIGLGSISNPGSYKWDTFLGAENIPDYPNRELPRKFQGGSTDGAMGDIHPYMNVPVDADTRNWLRTLGSDTLPVFISETGIGSQCDPMRSYLVNCDRKLMDVITVDTVKRVWELADEFLDFYDLRQIYPFVTDICKDADKLNGAQRTLLFDHIRSNPNVNGYSITSVGTGNEGIFEDKYVVKETVAHSIQEGWEPLRWALFTDERVVYGDRPFGIEAVLCNEDALSPGDYAACAYIKGKDGCVWRKEFTVSYPEEGVGNMPPLAASVLKDTVSLPEGEYIFSVRLLNGGSPFGGDLPITVTSPRPHGVGRISVWGISEKMAEFLERNGFEAVRELKDSGESIVIGNPTESDAAEKVMALLEDGRTLLFTDVEWFADKPELLAAIVGEGAAVTKCWGRLYHHDNVAVSHPVFEGLQNAGLLDLEKYGDTYPRYIVSGGRRPDKTLCAAVRIEATLCGSGLSLGEYSFGKGKAVLNAFRFEDTLGKFPYADRLFFNLMREYAM